MRNGNDYSYEIKILTVILVAKVTGFVLGFLSSDIFPTFIYHSAEICSKVCDVVPIICYVLLVKKNIMYSYAAFFMGVSFLLNLIPVDTIASPLLNTLVTILFPLITLLGNYSTIHSHAGLVLFDKKFNQKWKDLFYFYLGSTGLTVLCFIFTALLANKGSIIYSLSGFGLLLGSLLLLYVEIRHMIMLKKTIDLLKE